MPSRIDKEPYFDRWNSVLVISPSYAAHKLAHLIPGKPFYQHKTCEGLVPVDETRIPPKVCPECGVDCVKEQKELEAYERDGIEIKDNSKRPVVPLIRSVQGRFEKPSQSDS